jgi:hypothetical protein
VAQLVEHHLAKVRVAGSNPVVRSNDEGLGLLPGAFGVRWGGVSGFGRRAAGGSPTVPVVRSNDEGLGLLPGAFGVRWGGVSGFGRRAAGGSPTVPVVRSNDEGLGLLPGAFGVQWGGVSVKTHRSKNSAMIAAQASAPMWRSATSSRMTPKLYA